MQQRVPSGRIPQPSSCLPAQGGRQAVDCRQQRLQTLQQQSARGACCGRGHGAELRRQGRYQPCQKQCELHLWAVLPLRAPLYMHQVCLWTRLTARAVSLCHSPP